MIFIAFSTSRSADVICKGLKSVENSVSLRGSPIRNVYSGVLLKMAYSIFSSDSQQFVFDYIIAFELNVVI